MLFNNKLSNWAAQCKCQDIPASDNTFKEILNHLLTIISKSFGEKLNATISLVFATRFNEISLNTKNSRRKTCELTR